MTAVVFLARAASRRHWRSLVVVTLLIGITGAAVLASVAGARRTSTSLERFRDDTRAGDVEIDLFTATDRQLDALRRDPAVASVGVLRQLMLAFPDGELIPSVAAVDGRFGTEIDRARVLEGRLPRSSRAHEIAISEPLASRLRAGVGDTVTLESLSTQQIDEMMKGGDIGAPEGPKVRFHIVGLVRRPLDLGIAGSAARVLFLTPAFEARYRDEIGGFVPALLRVRTTNGAADVPEVVKRAREIFGDEMFQVVGNADETAGARDAISVLTAALWIFAGVAALAGLTAIAIVIFRQVGTEEPDQPVLTALGLTTLPRAVAAGALALPAAIGGGVLAVVAAALISPLFPFGVARQAEPDPGFWIDVPALSLGLVAIVMYVLFVAATAGWRVARSVARERDARGAARPSTAARIAASARATPTLTTGMRLALEPGRGPNALPVRSAFFGAALGTLGIVAVLVFGASLEQLVSTPNLYGWAWDTTVVAEEEPRAAESQVCSDVTTDVTKDPAFAAVTAVCREGVEVDGRPVTGWGFTSLKGSLDPVVVSGRAPAAPDEVALGAELLDTIAKHIGDTVRIRGETSRQFRVVGQVLLPSPVTSEPEPIAGGAALTGSGLARIFEPITAPNLSLLGQFSTDVDPTGLPRNETGQWEFSSGVGTSPSVPVEVARLRQVDHLPLALAALLALLATVAVAHAIVLAIRRRRRDLAVLRTMGFTRRDVRSTIAYQATILTVLGLVVGIPAGLIVGRAVWRAVADGLGVAPLLSIPTLALAAVAIGALLIANLIGTFAAGSAIHDRPAAVLSAE